MLVIVYVFNFVDRQIISILAERIKADLGVSDAEIGFLYGTAFAVFYAVFGIPLARLADVWDRRKLIAIGLFFWSLMTALSGFARNFPELAAARFGVGIGEASASPAAFSLISDYFPAARRATVLAIYSSGIYLGAGLGIVLGGNVVGRWDAAFGASPPFGFHGWQIAFFVVGVPGLLLALWVWTLREPARGAMEGIYTPPEPHPFRAFFVELATVLPPFTILHLARSGGAKAVTQNVLLAVGLAVAATILTLVTRTPAQWIALAAGLYCAGSWAQSLGRRDPVAYEMILRTSALWHTTLAFSCLGFVGYAVGFWIPPFFVRVHQVDERTAGLVLGTISAVGGWIGITLGGVAADAWRRVAPCGRLYVGMLSAALPIPITFVLLTTDNLWLAYALVLPSSICSSMWIGPGASTMQDLVLPRIRGAAAAVYLLVITFIGLALGPYSVGLLSAMLGSLRAAMLCTVVVNVAALAFAYAAARHLVHDEASRLERARAAGEPLGSSLI